MTGARFHFDPTHDPAQVPEPDAVRQWVLDRMETPGSPLHLGTTTMMMMLGWRRRSILSEMLDMVPAFRRMRERRNRLRCIEAATAAVESTRSTMREFAVDLTGHPDMSVTLDTIGALGVLALSEIDTRRFIDHARANWEGLDAEIDELDTMMDQADTELRIAAHSAGIRAHLEGEALSHIVLGEDPALTREMRIAALRLAADEVRQVDLKKAVAQLIERLGPPSA